MYRIRLIEERDNERVEEIVRSCLVEFGKNHEGTVWTDENLGRLASVYNTERSRYWVAEDESGEIVGGVGIGYMSDEVCELQKMYCVREVRGKGVAGMLISAALEYAGRHYKRCYLETFSNMAAANRF